MSEPKPERRREHTGPSDEVGSEGGSPGDLDVEREVEISAGTEKGQPVTPRKETVAERDRQLTRDDRPRP